jgi:predicted PurR-regulated permease PerM
LLISGVAVGCGFVLHPFISAILWAAILAYSTWPVFLWLRNGLRLGRVGAAIIMVLLSAVVIALPLALAVPGGTQDVNQLRVSVRELLHEGLPLAPGWLSDIPLVGGTIRDYWNVWAVDLSAMEAFFRPYLGMIAENGLSLLLDVAGGLLNLLMALVIAFFFWWGGEQLASTLELSLQRIAGVRADRLMLVTGLTVRGVVYGVLGTAIVQGFLTAFGLWLSGVPRAVLFGAVAAALAVLPIGAPLVWIPASVWLFANDHMGWGIFLAIYGAVAVSGSDHILRPYFIARGAKLPYLLTLLGVLGGALAFGLLGIFLGPVLLGLGYSLVVEFAGASKPALEAFNTVAPLRRPWSFRRRPAIRE